MFTTSVPPRRPRRPSSTMIESLEEWLSFKAWYRCLNGNPSDIAAYTCANRACIALRSGPSECVVHCRFPSGGRPCQCFARRQAGGPSLPLERWRSFDGQGRMPRVKLGLRCSRYVKSPTMSLKRAPFLLFPQASAFSAPPRDAQSWIKRSIFLNLRKMQGLPRQRDGSRKNVTRRRGDRRGDFGFLRSTQLPSY